MDTFLSNLDKAIGLALRRAVCGFIFIYSAGHSFTESIYAITGHQSKGNSLYILIFAALISGLTIHSVHKSINDWIIFTLKICIISKCWENSKDTRLSELTKLSIGELDWQDSKWRWSSWRKPSEDPLRIAMSDWSHNLHMLYTSSLAIACGLLFLTYKNITANHTVSAPRIYVLITVMITFSIFAFISDIRKTKMQIRALRDGN